MIFQKEIWNVVNRKAFLFPYFASVDLLYFGHEKSKSFYLRYIDSFPFDKTKIDWFPPDCKSSKRNISG